MSTGFASRAEAVYCGFSGAPGAGGAGVIAQDDSGRWWSLHFSSGPAGTETWAVGADGRGPWPEQIRARYCIAMPDDGGARAICYRPSEAH